MKNIEQRTLDRIKRGELDEDELGTILFEAVRKCWTQVARQLLELGVDPNLHSDDDGSILSCACELGYDHVEIAKMLLDAGAHADDPDVIWSYGVRSLPLLLAAGGNINGHLSARHPLLYAIRSRTKQDKALALISHAAEVNVVDLDGKTPLMYAAGYGRAAVFDALVEAGAELLAVDHRGRGVLRHAMVTLAQGTIGATDTDAKGARAIIRKMQHNLPAQPEDMILIDVVLGNKRALRSALEKGLAPDTVLAGSIGWRGLSRRSYIEYITQQGDLVDLVGNVVPSIDEIERRTGGSTLLMWAVATQQRASVEVLLQAGADPCWKNHAGVSPVSFASQYDDQRIRDILENAGKRT
jgi:ankyrin repeat protein